jgi:hypothetical protein
MLEFKAISVSSYEASNLSAELQQASSDGWSVVSIVNAGSDIVAYLSRPNSEVRQETAAPAAEPADAGGVGWGMQSGTSASAPDAAETSSASSNTSSASAAPAGWYADPSGRFELRYWNGSKWTEHVSRAGQQSTDPPVA